MQLTFPHFDSAEVEMLQRCLDSKWVTQGPLTEQFEKLVAARHESRFAMATTSCTAALHLSAIAAGFGEGDEVIVPAFTWVTSAHCAEYVGAKPVFVDVDPSTFNLDPGALRAAITARTRAIVVVHLFGLAASMDEILDLAKAQNLFVIEDAACAIGTTYRGRPVGALGNVGCFSFHPRKIVTTGEGGMVTTNDPVIAGIVRSTRNHGATGMPDANLEPHGPWTMVNFDRLGFNLRLSDIQAAVGIAQMGKLDRLLARRRELAARYNEALRGMHEVAMPAAAPSVEGHSYQSYVIRLLEGGRKRRNAIMAALLAQDIQTRPGTHAVHRLGYYRRKYGYHAGDFPNASLCEDTTITLPLFPGMTDADQRRVVDCLRGALHA